MGLASAGSGRLVRTDKGIYCCANSLAGTVQVGLADSQPHLGVAAAQTSATPAQGWQGHGQVKAPADVCLKMSYQVGPPLGAAGPLSRDVLRSLDSADRLRPRCSSSLAAVGGPWGLSCAGHDPALCEAVLGLFCSASDADWLWRRRGDRGFCEGAVLPMVERPCISNLHERGKLLVKEC